jgi:predicted dehydrogenase
MPRRLLLALLLTTLAQAQPLRVAIAGLNHGHVTGFLKAAQARPNDITIVAIWDPAQSLLIKYANSHNFQPNQLYTDLNKLLDTAHPDAVATFSDTFTHLQVVQAAAPRHIPVMMEKPLAVNNQHAQAIQKLAQTNNTPVFVNYETTWYKSHAEIWQTLHNQKAAGPIRRMVAMDGHQGPREIGVQDEFFNWLNDPKKNGAGALFDFGCYGANLMTWLMDNQRPTKVTAITHTTKPSIYTKVDDEATILLDYPQTHGIIQASWNWPFSRKDFEVYGATGYAIATGPNNLRTRLGATNKTEESHTSPALPPAEADSISYLLHIVRDKQKPAGLSSLENNVIVTEILEAARESARTGKTILLPK